MWTCFERVESFPEMKGELDDEAEVYDTRIAGRRLRNWASSNSSAHARKWFAGSRKAAVEAHDRQPSRLAGRTQYHQPGLHRFKARREMGSRHLLRLDTPGLALSGRRYRPLRTTGGRLGYR